MKKAAFVVAACVALAVVANADLYINEVLGSTDGSDWEFIELYNSGNDPVDIGDWQIELWDSDDGTSYGGADGGSPYIVPTGRTTLPAGGFYLMANGLAAAGFGVTPDFELQNNAIENSSYTIILRDNSRGQIIDSIFVTDGDAGDSANDAGTPITPAGSIGPDGQFLPAGFYRVGDGQPTLEILEFSTPAPSATPGGPNIPEPASLLLVGLGALVLRRR